MENDFLEIILEFVNTNLHKKARSADSIMFVDSFLSALMNGENVAA